MKTQNHSFLIYCVLFLVISYVGIAQDSSEIDVKRFQFSFVPPVSSNGPQNAQTINKISLNLLAGSAYGVQAVEVGGVYNFLKGNVNGAQISGFGNNVGGEVHGLQLAGFINTNQGYVEGAQIAGFINVTSDSTRGLQLGGFSNISQETRGFQVAGFNNHNKGTKGTQLAGFINTTGDLDGLQLSGFMNKAKNVKGVQFGIINVADSVESGVQVGLINVSKKNGFISPGLETDDTMPYRFVFRSGLEKFYALLSAGVRPDEYWSYGAGFGSRLFLSQRRTTFFNPELRFHNINKGKLKANRNNHLVKLNMNFGYKAFKHLYITTGPSINFYMSNRLDRNGQPEINLKDNPSWDHRSGRNSYQLWVGYSIGIGF